LNYRNEINGLRAIAIIPVILFHAGFSLFTGGYIGVDVFFVISGYLITGIIVEDLEAKRFKLADFYARRVRRILPALFVVSTVCIPFSWLWMRPDQMRDFLQSLVAVSIFLSNVFFWHKSGYFNPASEEAPLLHTWSLAVEEQFYLAFPLMLLLLWRWGKSRVFWITALLLLGSLLLSEYAWRSGRASAGFYLAPTRAWELLAGSLAAFYVHRYGMRPSNLLSIIGFLAIIFSFFIYDSNTPFPSLFTLLPVAGVVLILLFATQSTLINKLLSMNVLAGLGLISYSAYLWHQPLFAFARINHVGLAPSLSLMLALAVFSLFLAFLTYKFIEQPFRTPKILDHKRVWWFASSATLIPIVASLLLMNMTYSSKFELDHGAGEFVAEQFEEGDVAPCEDFIAFEGDATCNRLPRPSGIKVVVWGDSHALVMEDASPNLPSMDLITIVHNGCPPLIGVRRFDEDSRESNCSKFGTIEKYVDYINSQKPDVVILVGRWSLYVNGWYRNGIALDAHHLLQDEATSPQEILESKALRKEVLIDSFARTVSALDAKKIAILDQATDYGMLGMSDVLSASDVSRDLSSDYNVDRYDVLNNVASVDLLLVDRLFCGQLSCMTKLEGESLYRDDNHLSRFAAGLVWGEVIKPYINKSE
jgi:peptidoglycan/LPS O-acetylase OafA/YrhL